MRIDNFSGKFGLIVVSVNALTRCHQNDRDEKQCDRGNQPVPKERPRLTSRGCDCVERGVNLPPQLGGGRLIELRELQSIAQQIQVDELRGTVAAMSEVTLEFPSPAATQLTSEIALKQRAGKVTSHGQAP